MPRPKKTDRLKKEEIVPDIKQDREEFLRTFEKPTQIYRFLRARHFISPIFLHRSLLYMLRRCSRTHARRKKFRVNDLLEQCLLKQSNTQQNKDPQFDQLKVLVSGFYIDPGVKSENNVNKKLKSLETQVSLCKIHRSRRKEGELAKSEEILGTTDTPINPRNADAFEDDPLYLNTTDMFQPTDGPSFKNYSLVFRVFVSSDDESDNTESESEASGSEDNSDSNWSDGEKKRKKEDDPAGISLRNLTTGRRRRIFNNEDKEDYDDMDEETNEVRSSKRKNCSKFSKSSDEAIYEAELSMFNSDKKLLLTEGEYELGLSRKISKSGNKSNASWEALDGGRDIDLLSSMTNSPLLKFKLVWITNKITGPLASGDNPDQRNPNGEPDAKRMRRRSSVKINESPAPLPVDLVEYRKVKLQNKGVKSEYGTAMMDDMDGGSEMQCVFYQFIYNRETQQQTEARDDLDCPWCQLNCITLYGLIKHLKLCHPRFNFTFIPSPQGSCIEVTINECYDGSFCGNPQFVFAQPGMAFGRHGPVRRIEVTDTLVYRPQRDRRRRNLDLGELLEKEETEKSPTAHYSAGHHRLYFHSTTAVPVRPCEFSHDSEDELDPDWLRAYTKRMLDEFTDVNEGEKPIMKLWNLYIMKNICIADAQLHKTCQSFINLHASLIARHSLRGNLLLHFVTLVDFGVLKSSSLITLMQHFDEVVSNLNIPTSQVKCEDEEDGSSSSSSDVTRGGGRKQRISVGDTKMGRSEALVENEQCNH